MALSVRNLEHDPVRVSAARLVPGDFLLSFLEKSDRKYRPPEIVWANPLPVGIAVHDDLVLLDVGAALLNPILFIMFWLFTLFHGAMSPH